MMPALAGILGVLIFGYAISQGWWFWPAVKWAAVIGGVALVVCGALWFQRRSQHRSRERDYQAYLRAKRESEEEREQVRDTPISAGGIARLVDEATKDFRHPLLEAYFAIIPRIVQEAKPRRMHAETVKNHIAGAAAQMHGYVQSLLKETPPSPLIGSLRTDVIFPGYNILKMPSFTKRLTYSDEGDYYIEPLEAGMPGSHPLYAALDEAFRPIWKIPQPGIPYEYDRRFEHTWICGTTGSGKSTLLKRLILHDLEAEKPPSLVVLENRGDVVPWLTRLGLFHPKHGKLKDKIIIFSPSQPPPAINPFYRYVEGETGVEDTMSILRYLFSSLDVDMTGKQGSLFEPCARFLLTFPDTLGTTASLRDFSRLLANPTPPEYLAAISKLDRDPQTAQGQVREFMEDMFNSPTYKDTKNELRQRIETIRTRGYLGRMLSAETTGLNLYKHLNEGGVIAIDAAGLGDNSALYGRVCIALVLQAVFARFAIPDQYRKPTFFYVDEAQYYFDIKTRELLTNARKFKMGGVFAHQQLDDLKESGLEPYFSGQTSIRFIGRAPAGDWSTLAAYVDASPGATAAQRHDPEFIGRQRDHHFACWIRGVTVPHGVSVTVDAEKVAAQRPMDDRAYEELLLNNRTRIGGPEQRKSRDRQATPPPRHEQETGPPIIDLEQGSDGVYTARQRPDPTTTAILNELRRLRGPSEPASETPSSKRRWGRKYDPPDGDIDTGA